jgi:hypothetical protein
VTTKTTSGIAAMIALSIVCPSANAAAKHRAPDADDNRACVTTYRRALEHAQAGRLRAARESFLSCSRSACGELVRRDCTARYEQLGADIPSVVPLVTDGEGEPRVLVEVRIDGELVASRLDGRALPMDPGKHELSFSTDSGVFATRQVVIAQGERNRSIHVVLRPSDEHPGRRAAASLTLPAGPDANQAGRPPVRAPSVAAAMAPALAPSQPAPHPAVVGGAPPQGLEQARQEAASDDDGPSGAAYVFGAFGLAGVGGYALLTYWGRSDNNMLADCSPGCPDASVRHVRQLYWAADATLGVGVVALAVSTWLFASSGSSEKKPSEEHALRFHLQPAHTGAVATVGGAF